MRPSRHRIGSQRAQTPSPFVRTYHLIVVLALTSSVCVASLEAQQLPSRTVSQIDARFADFADASRPGCAVGVGRNGAPVFAKGYGAAVLEYGVPISPSTAFNLGSASKQFTAFLTLLLVRDGKLTLDDEVRRYVPELTENTARMRVRDLLYHTSGLRDYSGLARLAGRPSRDPVRPMEEFVALLARQRGLNFAPGTRHQYVHTDYNLLGVVIERVMGKRLGELLEQMVWKPLGMTSTHLLDDRSAPIPHQALAYVRAGDVVSTRFPAGALRGGTDVYSTAEDMLRWNATFDRPLAGTEATMAAFLGRPTMASGDTIPYVHGIYHGYHRSLPVLYRAGHGGHFSADQLHFRATGVSFVVLCNTPEADTRQLVRDVADIVLAERLGPTAPAPPLATTPTSQAELDRMIGSYASADAPWLPIDVTAREGTLFLRSPLSTQSYRLARLEDGRWTTGFAFIRLAPDHSGQMQMIVTLNEDDPPIVQRRVSTQSWRPSPLIEPEALAGTFYSSDLVTEWRIVQDNGTLLLRRPGQLAAPLIPIQPDLFAVDLDDRREIIGIAFIRENGRVVALEVSDGTADELVLRLRFDRVH